MVTYDPQFCAEPLVKPPMAHVAAADQLEADAKAKAKAQAASEGSPDDEYSSKPAEAHSGNPGSFMQSWAFAQGAEDFCISES